MSANSKHYGDVILWIEKVIASCKTVEQLNSTRRLVRNFSILYEDIDRSYNFKLSRKLSCAINSAFVDLP